MSGIGSAESAGQLIRDVQLENEVVEVNFFDCVEQRELGIQGFEDQVKDLLNEVVRPAHSTFDRPIAVQVLC